jgi:multiple sugar transport system permease protein
MRRTAAAVMILLFFVLFFFSSVSAGMGVGEVYAVQTFSFGSILFSLSSFAVLLLPLSLALMAFALISLLSKRNSPAALFSLLATLSLGVFLILYSREKMNNSLYNALSDLLKEAGAKFRKRDITSIDLSFSPMVYLVLLAGVLSSLLSLPGIRTRQERYTMRRELLPYAYIGPHLLFFIIFFITPSMYGIYAAFTKWNLFNDPIWVGLENFRILFTETDNTYYFQLRNGLWNTVKFVLYSVPFTIIVPLSLAYALQSKPRGNKFFQALYYIPSLMSITTVTLAWRYMFFKSYGVMNHFFMTTPDWFIPPYSWIMLVVVTVWWVNGGTMVIYQSALASIPHELYEAAAVDGANERQKFISITLPNMRYPLMYTLILAVVAQFNIYGQPLMLTGFGNNEANAVLLMYVYENAVKKQVAGISAAMALVLGVCIMSISFVQMRLMRANTPD